MENGDLGFQQCLQVLSNDKGVWRANLIDLLRGDLRELQHVWRLNLDGDPGDVHQAIEANMRSLITRIKPRPARQRLSVTQRVQQYRYAVEISFNVFPPSEVKAKGLEERRAWLANEAPEALRVKVTTSRRELAHAIEQMAEILASEVLHLDQSPVSHDESKLGGNKAGSTKVSTEVKEYSRLASQSASPTASIVPTIERIHVRVKIEFSALKILLKNSISKIRKEALRLTLTGICLSIVLCLSSYLFGRQIADPPWSGSLRPLVDYGTENPFSIFLIFASVTATFILPGIFFWKRRRSLAICAIVSSLVIVSAPAIGIYIVFMNEMRPHEKLAREVATWNLQHALMFNGKNSRGGDPYQNICKELYTEPLGLHVTNEVIQRRVIPIDGEELSRSRCSIDQGELVLHAPIGFNGLPGDRAQNHPYQFYAEALILPVDGTFWSECGMAAVPAYDSNASSFLKFGLEIVDGIDRPSYRPVVSMISLTDDKVVARSEDVIPYNMSGLFGNSTRAGWLKFGVHRKGNEYTYFVNDHKVLAYTWVDSVQSLHVSLQVQHDLSYRRNRPLTCRFDDFTYWTKPVAG